MPELYKIAVTVNKEQKEYLDATKRKYGSSYTFTLNKALNMLMVSKDDQSDTKSA
jgi:hypothetical protein